MDTLSIGKKQLFNGIKITILLLCLISLFLPWLRFEVKTDRGNITFTIDGYIISQAEDEIDASVSEIADTYNTKLASQFRKVCCTGIRILKYCADSKLSPVETALVFTNAGKLCSQADALTQTAMSELGEYDINSADVIQGLLEYISIDVSDVNISALKGTMYFLAAVSWLMIAAMVAVGVYSIYALIVNRRHLMWAEAALYGVMLLIYCVFAISVNQSVSEELSYYREAVGKSIRPFHIRLWPILVFLCLLASLTARYILPRLSSAKEFGSRLNPHIHWESVKGWSPNLGWTCTCGKRNAASAQFCSKCGSKRSSDALKRTWTCSGCGAENPKSNVFCSHCGKRRTEPGYPSTAPKAEGTRGFESGSSGASNIKINMGHAGSSGESNRFGNSNE